MCVARPVVLAANAEVVAQRARGRTCGSTCNDVAAKRCGTNGTNARANGGTLAVC